jgi:hypothetical protein
MPDASIKTQYVMKKVFSLLMAVLFVSALSAQVPTTTTQAKDAAKKEVLKAKAKKEEQEPSWWNAQHEHYNYDPPEPVEAPKPEPSPEPEPVPEPASTPARPAAPALQPKRKMPRI